MPIDIGFPIGGTFRPKPDYRDLPPLNTLERNDLKQKTLSALDELHKKLDWDYESKKIVWKIKTFDKGFGLRIRDDAGNRIWTASNGEEVRIVGRKTDIPVEGQTEKKNFVKEDC